MKAVGICRVSTEEQGEEGVSLDAQEARIRAYCSLYGIEIVAVFHDTGSGKDMEREGLQRGLKMLSSGEADCVVVAKLDRLTRSLDDLQYLLKNYFNEKTGFSLCAVDNQLDTNSANGRMVINLLMTVFQWEREVICERTRDALRHKKAKGQRVGSVPYGKDLAPDGVTLVDNEVEQQRLKWMRAVYVNGWSYEEIAQDLNKQGIPTKKVGQIINGKPVRGVWTKMTVARLIA